MTFLGKGLYPMNVSVPGPSLRLWDWLDIDQYLLSKKWGFYWTSSIRHFAENLLGIISNSHHNCINDGVNISILLPRLEHRAITYPAKNHTVGSSRPGIWTHNCLTLKPSVTTTIPFVVNLGIRFFIDRNTVVLQLRRTLWGLPRTDTPMSSACLLSVEKL